MIKTILYYLFKLEDTLNGLYYTILPHIHFHTDGYSLSSQGFGTKKYCPGCKAIFNNNGTILKKNVRLESLHNEFPSKDTVL